MGSCASRAEHLYRLDEPHRYSRKKRNNRLDQEYRFFVGIDWGTQTHRIVLLDGEGRAIEQYDAAHTGDGLQALVNRIVRSTACEPERVAIAIETSWGALVETLLDHGFAVFSINPKQVDRFRDRFSVAGAKDDTRDALVLASSLRTDRRSFRLVEIDSPDIIRLRELSRFQEELRAELRRATNRLWQQLHRYYPQALQLSPAADSLFVWDLLRNAPNPATASKLSLARIRKLLFSHRISRFTAEEVRNKLYFAFRELGYVVRTIFLLEYLSDVELRRLIQSATNKSERFNQFVQWVAFGGGALASEGIRDEQRKFIKYNHLVANLLIYHNVVSMTKALERLTIDGHAFDEDLVASTSPYQTEHINRFGRYTLKRDRIPEPLDGVRVLRMPPRSEGLDRATKAAV